MKRPKNKVESVDMYKESAERFELFVEKSKLNQAEIARISGVAAATLSRIKSAEQVMGPRVINALSEFFDVNKEWLKSGVGEMGSAQPRTINARNNEVQLGPFRISRGNTDDYDGPVDFNISAQVSREKPNMWMVPIKAQAGFVRGFEGRTFRSQIQQVAWPLVNGECFCFEVEGLSMFPVYLPNTWLVCTILNDWGWLRKDRNYVFQTYDGLYIKQFEKIDQDLVWLNSINKDYPVAPIAISELRMIYVVEGRYMKE